MLDEEDLDLIGEANPQWERKTQPQVGYIYFLSPPYQQLTHFIRPSSNA